MTSQLDGITIRGIPLQVAHPGKVFWVNNSSVVRKNGVGGNDQGSGTYQRPFATIDYAIGRCTASRGDIIAVGAGHAENVTGATDIDIDVAGVAIVGLGVGAARPTLTLTSATTTIGAGASNCSVYNILHVANFADVATFYQAVGTPKDFTIENCEFRDTSSILNGLTCFTDTGVANACDGFHFKRNHVHGLGTTAATQAITFSEATARMELKDNIVLHAAVSDTPALVDLAAKNHLDLQIMGNRTNRPQTSSTGGALAKGGSTASTGMVSDNYAWHLDNSTGLLMAVSTDLAFIQNFCPITGAADKSGLINPAIEA
jgi:hypothetical protein